MDLHLNGRVAMVTGGSHGMGKQAALSLAREGCMVSICARGEEQIKEAVEELRLCREDGTLPGKAHLESDSDMEPLHDFPPYQELVRGLDLHHAL